MNLKTLTNLKDKLDFLRPFDVISLNSLLEDLSLNYTYNSTAIEGNTLTIYETKAVVEDGITIGGKTLREHLEVINHAKAVEQLINDVQNKRPLDLKVILDYHELVLKGINDDWAGRYRNQQVFISGAKHIPAHPQKVYDQMEEFINNELPRLSLLHPVEYAAKVHAILVKIHPFVDGNGRTARLIMNLELMKSGYPITIIEVEDKSIYCSLLDECCVGGKYDKFVNFIAEKVEKSFEKYFLAFENNIRETENECCR